MRPALGFRAAGAATALLWLVTAAPAAAQPQGCRPTAAQYRALKRGMSRAAVDRHLGCAGRRVSRLRIGTQRRAVYTWYGRGTYGANLDVTFADGRLADKSQLGLR